MEDGKKVCDSWSQNIYTTDIYIFLIYNAKNGQTCLNSAFFHMDSPSWTERSIAPHLRVPIIPCVCTVSWHACAWNVMDKKAAAGRIYLHYKIGAYAPPPPPHPFLSLTQEVELWGKKEARSTAQGGRRGCPITHKPTIHQAAKADDATQRWVCLDGAMSGHGRVSGVRGSSQGGREGWEKRGQ